jgi:hypothetical protein
MQRRKQWGVRAQIPQESGFEKARTRSGRPGARRPRRQAQGALSGRSAAGRLRSEIAGQTASTVRFEPLDEVALHDPDRTARSIEPDARDAAALGRVVEPRTETPQHPRHLAWLQQFHQRGRSVTSAVSSETGSSMQFMLTAGRRHEATTRLISKVSPNDMRHEVRC